MKHTEMVEFIMFQPRIFISAVSQEFQSARQIAIINLKRLGYETESQDTFNTEYGDLRKTLQRKIDRCQGVIHFVGRAYGMEPFEPDSEFGRVSYTQFEFEYARKRKKKTWVFYLTENYPTATAKEDLDLPRTAEANPSEYQSERRILQAAWYERLRKSGHIRYTVASELELRSAIDGLRDDLEKLPRVFRRWMLALAAIGLTVLFAVVLSLWFQTDSHEKIGHIDSQTQQVQQTLEVVDHRAERIEAQLSTIRPDDIEAHLRREILETYKRDKSHAEQIPEWEIRLDARKKASDTLEKRLAMLPEVLESIDRMIRSGEATVEFLEFSSILQKDGADAALKYFATQDERLLREADRLTEKKRRVLAPHLEAARVHLTRGNNVAAQKQCEKILHSEMQWSEAWEVHSWSLVAQGESASRAGHYPEALKLFESADESAMKIRNDSSNPTRREQNHFDCLLRIGEALQRMQRATDAIPRVHTAAMIMYEEAQKNRHDRRILADLIDAYHLLTSVYLQARQSENAFKTCLITISMLESIPEYKNNEYCQRELAIFQILLGDINFAINRYTEAKIAFQKYLDIALSKQKSTNAEYFDDTQLLIAHERMGDVCYQLHEYTESEIHLRKFLKIARNVHRYRDDDLNAIRNLHIAMGKYGLVLVQLGRKNEGLQCLEESLQLCRNANQPLEFVQRHNLLYSLKNLAHAKFFVGQYHSSCTIYQECLEIINGISQFKDSASFGGLIESEKQLINSQLTLNHNAIIATLPWGDFLQANKQFQSFFLRLRATEFSKAGNLFGTEQAGEYLHNQIPYSCYTLYDSAICYGLCANITKQSPYHQDLHEAYRKKTMQLLILAFRMNFQDFDALQYDQLEAFRSIKDLPEFQALLPKSVEH